VIAPNKIDRVVSLFDGLSGGRIALDRLGVEVGEYYASEVDKYAMQVSGNNYPDIIQIGDVTKLTDEDLIALGDVDLLIGGSPCQGFSMSGKMVGSSTVDGVDVTSLEQYLELKEQGFEFAGQSYLFWEWIRVREIIKPTYFFLENVKMKKKWSEMFDDAVGVDYIEINSALVSAQNRKRNYWTNIPGVTVPEDAGERLSDVLECDVADREKSFCITAPYYKGGTLKNYFEKSRRQKVIVEGSVFFGDNYLENREKLKEDPDIQRPGNVRNLYPEEVERLQTVPVGFTSGVSNTQRYKMLGNGWTIDVISHIFKNLFGK